MGKLSRLQGRAGAAFFAAAMTLFAPLAHALEAEYFDVDLRANRDAAALMSLDQARQIIQRQAKWFGADCAADHGQIAVEFTPTNLVVLTFTADGRRNRLDVCRYEDFSPSAKINFTVGVGAHKGAVGAQVGVDDLDGDCSGHPNLVMLVPNQDIATQLARALFRWKNSKLPERQAYLSAPDPGFAAQLASYNAASPKPALPEEVRRFQVIAQAAVRDKRFADAANAYEDALKLAPWWPEGQYNTALMLAEIHYYDEAIAHMKNYIALAPAAPDARAAQDAIYEWEGQMQAAQ